MYDALTTRYTFSCPTRGETRVRLSAFRALDRLHFPQGKSANVVRGAFGAEFDSYARRVPAVIPFLF
jgi:hypothetical protein